MSSEKFNPSCPTFCYRTEYDNMAQKMWCPIAQQPIKNAQGQILGQDSNLMTVITGGNMKRFNAEQVVEGYQYGFEGRYRPVAQLNNDLQGPLCYGAGSECHWAPHTKPTKAPGTRPPATRRPVTAGPKTASPKVKESYCGCTSRQVMDSGINMMSTY